MARRRSQGNEIISGVFGLVMVVTSLAWFRPAFRETLLKFAIIGFGILVLVAVIAIGVCLIRRANRLSTSVDLPPLLDARVESPAGSTMESQIRKSIAFDWPSGVSSPPKLAAAEESSAGMTTADLIGRLRAIDWFQFEKIVAVTYRKLGYAVSRRGGANPDGGIDLIIEKEGQQVAVQCKQWKAWNVGVKVVREFLGALADAQLPKGVLITLGGYTADAKALAVKHGIELLTEKQLATLLEPAGAALDDEVQRALRDDRKFCPKCEHMMVLRTATKGISAGQQFWGCSRFPKCRFMMRV